MTFNKSIVKNFALLIALASLVACGGGSSSGGGSAQAEKRVDECIQKQTVPSPFEISNFEISNVCDFAINVGVRLALNPKITDIYSLAPGQTAADTLTGVATVFACRAPSLPISSGEVLNGGIKDNCT